MKYNQNRRLMRMSYAVFASLILLTGFTSLAAEPLTGNDAGILSVEKDISAEPAQDETKDTAAEIKAAAEKAYEECVTKVEDGRRKAEEAKREAQRKAEEAAAQEAARIAAEEKELLAALIFCEAGNQPYEGQVAVGAVVMNRVNSGQFPDTITDVIYQSGQFTPAMTGWLDSVLAGGGYTDSAMQAAGDALAGSNPIGDCLYFSTGGGGYQLGDHFFR